MIFPKQNLFSNNFTSNLNFTLFCLVGKMLVTKSHVRFIPSLSRISLHLSYEHLIPFCFEIGKNVKNIQWMNEMLKIFCQDQVGPVYIREGPLETLWGRGREFSS